MADEIKTTGRDELIAKMNSLAGTDTFTAQVGTQSTTGSVRRKDGDVDVSRSAVDNIIVLRTQAKAGRDIGFLSDGEASEAQSLWRAAINAFLASGIAADLEAGARHVAEFIAAAYARHIERGEGASGPVAPVLPSTQKQKDREVRPGLPPLVRTGQLLRSFLAGVRRG